MTALKNCLLGVQRSRKRVYRHDSLKKMCFTGHDVAGSKDTTALKLFFRDTAAPEPYNGFAVEEGGAGGWLSLRHNM